MRGIIIRCEVLYFVTFRKPASTSLILTYPIPPFTTIRGMIANALGLQQHDHSLQDQIKIGLRVLDAGFKNVEMAKILKLKEQPRPPGTDYPSSPMFKEYLLKPVYEFFVAGKEQIMKDIHTALILPQRPLYLGQSDDLIDITTSELLNIEEKMITEFHTILEGTHADCFIERVPYTFKENKGKYSVDYRIISIPKYMEPIKVSAIGYNFNGINVCLF